MNWPHDDLEQPLDRQPEAWEPEPDPLDDGDRDGGPLEDASEEAMARWAEAYDDLNGAPENDDDR